MGLTYRGNLNRPLTTGEIDGNFQHFTGSHSITGSLTISSPIALNLTGSILISGSIIPNTNPDVDITSSFDLGSDTSAWRHIYVSNGSIKFLSGSTGNITSSSFSTTAGGIEVSTNLIPAVGSDVSLGSTTAPFTDLNIGPASINFISSSAIIASLKTAGETGVNGSPDTKGMIYVQSPSSSINRGSFGIGLAPTASGIGSFSQGQSVKSSGSYSHAQGVRTTAAGYGSHAEGIDNTALGSYSHVEGIGNVAKGDYQLVIGQYNISSSIPSSFIIGNGTSNNKSNLLATSGSVIQITGSLDITGSIASGKGTIILSSLVLNSYSGDSEAAAAGIPIGGLYRNGSFIQIRLV